MKRTRAELVWIQSESGYSWSGRLLNGAQARDQQNGDKPAEEPYVGFVVKEPKRIRRYAATITAKGGGVYQLVTRGPHKSSTRYRTFYPTIWDDAKGRYVAAPEGQALADAQLAGSQWARRRFWIDPGLES